MDTEVLLPLALAVHGGAWNMPDGDVEPHREGVARALVQGWQALQEGASALDVVELTVRMLEDDPTFNAGRGAHLNSVGGVQLDASIMAGEHLEAGAVAAVERLRHPVCLARRVLEDSAHVLLVGSGAQRFAREQGIPMCRNRDLLVGREKEHFLSVRRREQELVTKEFDRKALELRFGTVGAVACDREGHVAAATSTGGTQDKAPGRVGDSAIIGAGTYADDRTGAVSATGWGEGIIRVGLAKAAADALGAKVSPGRAGSAAVRRLDRVKGKGGLILVDTRGSAAAVFNTPRMARGVATEKQGLKVGVGPEFRRP